MSVLLQQSDTIFAEFYLANCLQQYLCDIIDNKNDVKDSGICRYFYGYLLSHNISFPTYDDFLISKFVAYCGISDYPFNYGEEDKFWEEWSHNKCHENPRRLAWVRDYLSDYPDVITLDLVEKLHA